MNVDEHRNATPSRENTTRIRGKSARLCKGRSVVFPRRRWWMFSLFAVLVLAVTFSWRRIVLEVRLWDVQRTLFTEDPEQLLESLGPLGETFSDDARVAYFLAVALRRSGQLNAALERLELARHLGWAEHDISRERQMLQFQAGDIEHAERWLMDRIVGGCTDYEATAIYECLVKGYLLSLRLDDAGFCLNNWLEWQPKAVPPRLIRAELLVAVANMPRAMEEYRSILRDEPDQLVALKALGDASLEINDPAGALEPFEHYLRLRPHDARVRTALASCYRRLDRLSEAQAAIDIAFGERLDSESRALALAELAQIALARGDTQQSIDASTRAIELDSQLAAAHYTLARALSRGGDRDRARMHFDESYRLNSVVEKYVDLLDDAARDPEDPVPRCALGQLEFDRGHRERALAWLQSALRCDPKHAATRRALSRYYAERTHGARRDAYGAAGIGAR
jgi:tetratricopeptide (TPR) repeat protein